MLLHSQPGSVAAIESIPNLSFSRHNYTELLCCSHHILVFFQDKTTFASVKYWLFGANNTYFGVSKHSNDILAENILAANPQIWSSYGEICSESLLFTDE